MELFLWDIEVKPFLVFCNMKSSYHRKYKWYHSVQSAKCSGLQYHIAQVNLGLKYPINTLCLKQPYSPLQPHTFYHN
jgi:hypothetical protein